MNKIKHLVYESLKKSEFIKLCFWRSRSVFLKLAFRLRNPTLYLGRRVQIIGTKKVKVGKSCSFGDDFWLNIQNNGYRDDNISVSVGDYSNIGRSNFFTLSEGLYIGEYFFSSYNCRIIAASHEADPLHSYVNAPVVPLGKPVRIGVNVFMGANAMIIGGVKIGYGSIIGAGAVVTDDVPPLSQVVGNPAKVKARYSMAQRKWIRGEEPVDDIVPEEDYLELVKIKCPTVPIPYHAASTRNNWT